MRRPSTLYTGATKPVHSAHPEEIATYRKGTEWLELERAAHRTPNRADARNIHETRRRE